MHATSNSASEAISLLTRPSLRFTGTEQSGARVTQLVKQPCHCLNGGPQLDHRDVNCSSVDDATSDKVRASAKVCFSSAMAAAETSFNVWSACLIAGGS